jgi:hypothetical protein
VSPPETSWHAVWHQSCQDRSASQGLFVTHIWYHHMMQVTRLARDKLYIDIKPNDVLYKSDQFLRNTTAEVSKTNDNDRL